MIRKKLLYPLQNVGTAVFLFSGRIMSKGCAAAEMEYSQNCPPQEKDPALQDSKFPYKSGLFTQKGKALPYYSCFFPNTATIRLPRKIHRSEILNITWFSF